MSPADRPMFQRFISHVQNAETKLKQNSFVGEGRPKRNIFLFQSCFIRGAMSSKCIEKVPFYPPQTIARKCFQLFLGLFNVENYTVKSTKVEVDYRKAVETKMAAVAILKSV